MRTKWISTGSVTIEEAKKRLAMRDIAGQIWLRWFRTYDNPHGGGSFGKSKEYCTVELVGVTEKRLRVKDHSGLHFVNPEHCQFAVKVAA